MWIDARGVAHTVALPNPVDVMSQQFKASFDVLLSVDREAVFDVLERAEERMFDEDISILADPEKESAFERQTPPRPLLDGEVRSADEVNAAVGRTDWRWRLDVVCALIDYIG